MVNSFQVPDEILNRVRMEIMQIDGVQGVGESLWNDRPALKAFFLDHTSLNRANLPSSISGIPIISVVAGTFDKQ